MNRARVIVKSTKEPRIVSPLTHNIPFCIPLPVLTFLLTYLNVWHPDYVVYIEDVLTL